MTHPLPERNDGNVALCGACRRARTCHLGITTERLDADGVARFELTCWPEHEGGPGVAHGGWISWVMDETMGHLVLLHGHIGVTAKLEVDFIAPVPVGVPLAVEVWSESIERVKWTIGAIVSLASDGTVLARGRGLWIVQDPARYAQRLADARTAAGATDSAPPVELNGDPGSRPRRAMPPAPSS